MLPKLFNINCTFSKIEVKSSSEPLKTSNRKLPGHHYRGYLHIWTSKLHICHQSSQFWHHCNSFYPLFLSQLFHRSSLYQCICKFCHFYQFVPSVEQCRHLKYYFLNEMTMEHGQWGNPGSLQQIKVGGLVDGYWDHINNLPPRHWFSWLSFDSSKQFWLLPG